MDALVRQPALFNAEVVSLLQQLLCPSQQNLVVPPETRIDGNIWMGNC